MTITVELQDEAVATLLEMARSEQSDTTAIVKRLVTDGINQFATARNVAPDDDTESDWDQYPSLHDHQAIKAMFARDADFDRQWWNGLSEEQRVAHMVKIDQSSASKATSTADEVMNRVRAKARISPPK